MTRLHLNPSTESCDVKATRPSTRRPRSAILIELNISMRSAKRATGQKRTLNRLLAGILGWLRPFPVVSRVSRGKEAPFCARGRHPCAPS